MEPQTPIQAIPGQQPSPPAGSNDAFSNAASQLGTHGPTQQAGPLTYKATDGTQLDPTAVTLAKSIRQVESQGNYNAIGDKGQSHGAYQFNGDNYQEWAKQYGLDPSDMSPTAQDKVAYKRIEDMLKSGTPPSQVAARWNGAHFVNGQYQAINPAYVDKVKRAYQQQLSKGQPAQNTQNNGLGALTPKPSQEANPAMPTGQQATPQPPSNDNPILGAAKAVTNFALPIVGDIYHDIQGKNDKSILQQAGDLGMSALWFLPFGDIAEGLGAGAKALGLGEAAAKATGVIGTGLASGYAGDVSSNLAQGKTGGAAVTPGLGTIVGGGLGAAGLGAAKLYNKFLGEQEVVEKAQQAYEDAAGATKTGIKGMSKTASKGLDPNAEFVANAGIPPETQEINGRRVFTTGANSASQQTLQERTTALTNLRDKAISQTNATTDFEAMRQQMLDEAGKEFSGKQMTAAQKNINEEMDALKADPKYHIGEDGKMPLADATKLKSYFQNNANYDSTRPSFISQANGTAARVAKETVEAGAEGAGSPSIKVLNKLIQQHLDGIKFLNSIDGQTVKGGRVGKYLYEGIGAATGEGIATGLGGGLLGRLVGPAIGAMVGSKVSQFMQRLAVGGPLTAATLGRMATEDPEIVQQFLQYIGEQGGEKLAPIVKPAYQSSGGLVGQFLKNKHPIYK